MSSAEIIRSASVFMSVLILLRFTDFMMHYYKVIYPLRKQIEEGKILAPPPFTTMMYHVIVFYWVVVQCVASLWALFHHFPLNPFTYALFPAQIGLFWVLSKFARQYRTVLMTANQDTVDP